MDKKMLDKSEAAKTLEMKLITFENEHSTFIWLRSMI